MNIKTHSIITICLIVLLGLCYARFHSVATSFTLGMPTVIEGRVGSQPQVIAKGYSFKVGQITVHTSDDPGVDVGDFVAITGMAVSIRTIQAEEVVIGDDYVGSALQGVIQFEEILSPVAPSVLPKRQAALINGLVLGQKPKSDKPFMDALRKSGTIHIIVVSGANLTLVGAFLLRFKRYIGQYPAVILCLVTIWFYAALADFEPPVIRAAIMISLAYGAKLLGRQYWDAYALCLAAIVMVLVDPRLLVDFSFQLSFAATAGIVFLARPLTGVLAAIRIGGHILPRMFIELLAATLAAEAFVNPLLILKFHELSLLAPISNMLILPIVTYLTIGGALLLLLGSVSSILATMLGYFLFIPATYVIEVIMFFGQIPWGLQKLYPFTPAMAAAVYLYLGCLIGILSKRRNQETVKSDTMMLSRYAG